MQLQERVLIQGGAGGVGVAAIQLAREIGVTIFATAGSAEKVEFMYAGGASGPTLRSRSLRKRTCDVTTANAKAKRSATKTGNRRRMATVAL